MDGIIVFGVLFLGLGIFFSVRPDIVLKIRSGWVASLGGKYEPPKIEFYAYRILGMVIAALGVLIILVSSGFISQEQASQLLRPFSRYG